MADEEQQPIIIVKKSGGHAGHHGGAWKVAYADFVTALMAFFLVMWLVTQDDSVKENVAGYFNDPSGWGKGKSGSSILSGRESVLKGGQSILKSPGMKPPDRIVSEARAREVLKQAGERVLNALSELPNFDEVVEHIEIEMTEEGLRIELIEATSADSDSSFFFTSGSASISNTGETIISSIASELGKINNKIVIEGHTDSHQFIYKTTYSNWELSTDRANSARKLMVISGVKNHQVAEIRGYAANRPKIKDNPADARNRRVSILVQTDLDNLSIERMEIHEVIDGKVVKDIP